MSQRSHQRGAGAVRAAHEHHRAELQPAGELHQVLDMSLLREALILVGPRLGTEVPQRHGDKPVWRGDLPPDRELPFRSRTSEPRRGPMPVFADPCGAPPLRYLRT